MRGFDPNSPKWQCCCLKLKTGTIIASALETFLAIVAIIRGTVALIDKEKIYLIYWNHTSMMALELSLGILTLIAAVILITGVQNSIPNFLLFHLATQLISVLGIIILVVGGKFLQPNEPTEDQEKSRNLQFTIAIFAAIVVLLGEIYMAYLVVRCWHLIVAERRHSGVKNTIYRTVHKETIRRVKAEKLALKRALREQQP